MSWASHNPELYDEICKRGVMNYLMKKMSVHDTFTEEDVLEFLDDLEGSSYGGIKYRVWDILMTLANSDIVDAEINHFARRADAARDAAKYKGL